MRDYEKLRKVVEQVKDKAALHLMEHEPGNEHDWMFVRDVLGKVLADTAKTSEMARLIPWLEARALDYHQRKHPPHGRTSMSVSPVRAQEIDLILDHIKSEFLGGEDATDGS